jgi:prepilin-type N-terminal cleavage/methylation domain-containing protein
VKRVRPEEELVERVLSNGRFVKRIRSVRRQLGFTLLEVMIAVAIMGIGIVGALQLFSGSMNLAGASDQQSKATVLARALIDEEMWRDVLEENQRTGTEGIFSWTVLTQPIERELLGNNEDDAELHDVADELGLWLIHAEVRWQAALGEKTVLLETARIGRVPE